jgi:hypothetical protein
MAGSPSQSANNNEFNGETVKNYLSKGSNELVDNALRYPAPIIGAITSGVGDSVWATLDGEFIKPVSKTIDAAKELIAGTGQVVTDALTLHPSRAWGNAWLTAANTAHHLNVGAQHMVLAPFKVGAHLTDATARLAAGIGFQDLTNSATFGNQSRVSTVSDFGSVLPSNNSNYFSVTKSTGTNG